MTERKSAQERTADLLTAAELILERRRRITVSEIAREAGIASGTFYLYFPSKAHLEATLVDRVVAEHVAAASVELDAAEDAVERLEVAIAAVINFALEHEAIFRLHVMAPPTKETAAVGAQAVAQLRSLLEDAINRGVRESAFDVADVTMTATVLFHGIEGALRHAVAYHDDLDPDRLLETTRLIARRTVVPC